MATMVSFDKRGCKCPSAAGAALTPLSVIVVACRSLLVESL